MGQGYWTILMLLVSSFDLEKVQFSPLQLWRASVFPSRTIKPEIFPPPTLKIVRFTSLAGFGRWFCYSDGSFVFFFFIYFG
jgi:hypothetical protein